MFNKGIISRILGYIIHFSFVYQLEKDTVEMNEGGIYSNKYGLFWLMLE